MTVTASQHFTVSAKIIAKNGGTSRWRDMAVMRPITGDDGMVRLTIPAGLHTKRTLTLKVELADLKRMMAEIGRIV